MLKRKYTRRRMTLIEKAFCDVYCPSRNAASDSKWTQRPGLSKRRRDGKQISFFSFWQAFFQKHLNIVLSTLDNNKNKC